MGKVSCMKSSATAHKKFTLVWYEKSQAIPSCPICGPQINSFCRKYNLKVIIDLHAAPGSQNGWEHSGSRDGFQDWGKTNENIQQTVNVIDFLTARLNKL